MEPKAGHQANTFRILNHKKASLPKGASCIDEPGLNKKHGRPFFVILRDDAHMVDLPFVLWPEVVIKKEPLKGLQRQHVRGGQD